MKYVLLLKWIFSSAFFIHTFACYIVLLRNANHLSGFFFKGPEELSLMFGELQCKYFISNDYVSFEYLT